VLEDALHDSDKDLFMLFRDGQCSLAQLQARIHERKGRERYLVLDDLKDHWTEERKKQVEKFKFEYGLLFGKGKEVPLEQLLKPFQDWQINSRCLKSI